MRAQISLILTLTVFIQSSDLMGQRIHVMDHKLYGNLKNGLPDLDTLVEIKNKQGVLIQRGRLAMHGSVISNLKIGTWKEFNDDGTLKSKGSYKLGSRILTVALAERVECIITTDMVDGNTTMTAEN